MKKHIEAGIELLDDVPGKGWLASKGAIITYNARLYLRRGDEVTMDPQSIAAYGSHIKTREVSGVRLIDHTITLGKRQVIAGVEKSLKGMRAGGYREVLVAPHLGYREHGLPGSIPPNAILRIRLWLQEVFPAD